MIFFALRNKNIEKAISIALVIFFSLVSFAGADEQKLCFNNGIGHLVAQKNDTLVSCVPYNTFHETSHSPFAVLATSHGDHETPWVDIYINSCDSLISSLQLRKFLPQKITDFLSCCRISSFVGQAAKVESANIQAYLSFPVRITLQDVVLLI